MLWVTLSIVELFVIISDSLANSIAYLHCADLQPQPHVSIEQVSEDFEYKSFDFFCKNELL